MLVEFNRTTEREDEDGFRHPLRLAVNPNLVNAVLESAEHNGVVIVRLSDGRGFSVTEPYDIVVEKIVAGMKGKSPKAPKQLAPPADTQEYDPALTEILRS